MLILAVVVAVVGPFTPLGSGAYLLALGLAVIAAVDPLERRRAKRAAAARHRASMARLHVELEAIAHEGGWDEWGPAC